MKYPEEIYHDRCKELEKEIAILRRKDIEMGRKLEREAIVEWLRSDADAVVNEDLSHHADAIAEAICECAQAIAMGEHINASNQ